MMYVRLASGYRPPGVNEGTAINPKLPPAYAPDKTMNYELGVKGDFVDHTVSVDGSLYYIDWKDIQVNLLDPVSFLTYYINASRAKSEGAELSLQFRPWRGFSAVVWGTWIDAVLTRDFPPNSYVIGRNGDRLPFSSRFSGNLSLEQEFPLAGNVTGVVAASLTYVGDRQGDFQTSDDRQTFPAYTKMDLRTGLKFSNWSLNAYVTNLSDQRGILQSQLNIGNPNGFYLIQPRTIGINVTSTL
jgi:outer membrane receptor protein involved in Fe transport